MYIIISGVQVTLHTGEQRHQCVCINCLLESRRVHQVSLRDSLLYY